MSHLEGTGTYVLTDTEKTEVERVIRSVVPLYQPTEYDTFMSGCRLAVDKLPTRVLRWSERVKSLSVGLIRNLPIDDPLPKTPTTRHALDDLSMLADGVIGTVAALFGSVYTFEGKTTDRHIHNVYPIVGDEYTQLGSSKVELEWHVEDGFHPARPNWVALLCLRGDEEAETRIARARDLRLPPSILRILRQPRFKLRIDDSFSSETHSTHVTTRVLAGSETDPEIVFDPAYTVCEDKDETEAVAAVVAAAEQAHQSFTLVEGDLLIFDNRRVIHGRSSYQPRMDGTDRWLKRALILKTSEWSTQFSNGTIQLEFD